MGKSVSVSAHGRTVLLPKTPPNPLRERSNFASHFNAIWVVQIARQKYSASHFPQISSIFAPSRLIEEGRTRRHDTWSAGCGGREAPARARHCRAASSFVLGLVSNRSAQDERRCCVRQKRVVLAPVAGVKLAEADRIQPDSFGRQSGSDGGKRNSSPGRARHKPSNHCAGKAGCSPLDLYARVRTSLCTLHTRPRVQRAPGLPCALVTSRDKEPSHQLGARVACERRGASGLVEAI
ncbi:hypothetical protein V1279_006700 [Bradyrhizobium sp. AZCC 1610]